MEKKVIKSLFISMAIMILMILVLSFSLSKQTAINKQQEELIEKAIDGAYYNGAYQDVICDEDNYWNADTDLCEELAGRN